MTEAQYFQKVEKIEQLNRHCSLLERLKAGYSLINSMYVEQILSDLILAEKPQQKSVSITKTDAPVIERDAILRDLLGKKYGLRKRLFVEINKFHNCTSNDERREVSISVNQMEKDIFELQRDITFYDENGRLPPSVKKEEDDTFIVPNDLESIEKRLNACKVSISKTTSKIGSYDFKVVHDPEHAEYEDYKTDEKRLEKWKNYRIELKNKKHELQSHTV
jgi:hypothetical protein